jgi:hypothetical protein
MPRFVILEHDHPTLHWDLMLEHGATLKTWRLPQPPAHPFPESPSHDAAAGALPLPDHRLMYLDYEGPVSGDRGHVTRWDAGTYESVQQDAAAWTVRLAGGRWQGVVTLPLPKKTDR